MPWPPRPPAEADICIFSAAVADYRPARPLAQKAKRESADRDITSVELVKNPDIAATLGSARRPGQVMVGFALETDHEAEAATAKLARKHLDMIVLNSLRDPGAGFGTDTNKVTMYFADGRTPVATTLKSKADIAADILTQTISLT